MQEALKEKTKKVGKSVGPNGQDKTEKSLILPVYDGVAEIDRLTAENAALKAELSTIKGTHFELIREFQPYMDIVPVPPQELYAQACAGDKVTVDSWRDQWIRQTGLCKERFGNLREHSMVLEYGKYTGGTAIVAGSGPSLKRNGHLLKDRPKNVPLVSALHNYAYLLDRGVVADYYISLDAGTVVVDEMADGGKETAEFYWNSTKDKTLCCFIGSHPDLFDKWQGRVLLFSAPIPDEACATHIDGLEANFRHYISAGGNVLGGSTYFARAILGAYTIVWVGNDQSFSYNKQFYDWTHDLNGVTGQSTRCPDVFGILVHTWPSYFNFKCWFDFVSLRVPGTWINATEGGIIGAYREGNLRSIRQMLLKDVLLGLNAHEVLRSTFEGTADQFAVLF